MSARMVAIDQNMNRCDFLRACLSERIESPQYQAEPGLVLYLINITPARLVWDPSLGIVCLGSSAWELSLGIFRLGTFALDLSFGNYRLGSFAW